MKILFLPSYFYPEQAASSYLGQNRFTRYAEEGWLMVVYAPTPSRGVSAVIRHEYKTKHVEKMYDGYMTVRRFNLFTEGKNPLLRTLRYVFQGFLHVGHAVLSKDAKECELMFLSSTPPIQGMMGSIVKMLTNKKFIYCLQDIFPDSLAGTGLAKRGSLLWKIGCIIENFTYSHADKIIVISEDFKKNIMAKGVPEDKIAVIYNWVDQNAVVDVPRENNTLFDKYNLDRSKFYLEYSGNIGLTQNMDMLLEVMKELQTEKSEIRLVLIGEGAYKKQVEEIIKRDGITNVDMLPFQPYEQISEVFSLGDAGLVISKPGVGSNSVPSKTWSIMSASRPVIANFDENELKSIITDNECGIFTIAGDKEAFMNAIITLYENKEKAVQMGKNGREFVMKNLTRDVGTQKYVDVIKDVVNNRKQ